MTSKVLRTFFMEKKEVSVRNITILSTYILLVWGFYRFIFKFPEEVEEVFIKPILWLVPVFYFIKKERKGLSSLGITLRKLFPSIYYAIILGVVFALEGVLINFVKYSNIDFSANLGKNMFYSALGISFITAISEEITFRGYLFNRTWKLLGKEWTANIIISIIWGLVHIPVAIFWWKLSLFDSFVILFLNILFGIGSSFVFARTGNIVSSILLHVFWSWPIILFR